MTPIGGYFELETPRGAGPYHGVTPLLTSGRACLRHALSVISPRHVWVPYYTCNAVPETLAAAGVPYTFYSVNERLEATNDPILEPGELLIASNYFGLLESHMQRLSELYGSQLIVDDTQAFFARGYPGSWSFNSARKFFGVPDGAYLYAPVSMPPVHARNDEPTWMHLISRLGGHQEAGYRQFQASEAAITPIVLRASLGAERLLAGIDYRSVAERRRDNFIRYDAALGQWNRLRLPLEPTAVPMCYPFMPAARVRRELMYSQGVYPPTYWMDCVERDAAGFEWEKEVSVEMLPLPSDQRYEFADVGRVVALVSELMRV